MRALLRPWPLIPCLALFACGDSPSEVEEPPAPHDFDLTVRIGESVVRDGDPADADPEAGRIVLDGFEPEGFGGMLRVHDLLIRVEETADGEVEAGSTSTADAAEPSAQFRVVSDEAAPFLEVTVTVTADLTGFFSGDPAGYRGTVHLAGSYLPLDDAGAPREEGTISHAWIEFTGEAEAEGGGADGGSLPLGTVEGERVRDVPGPVPFQPEDVVRDLDGVPLATLRARTRMEIGPRAAVQEPVSALLELRAVRE